ncbi:MAG: hypothetical protein IT422_08330 [Pirellulaceae bacterium]|jgi:hypothetical protein|nr:hypothetical protein [Pirellulaceae bacterium]
MDWIDPRHVATAAQLELAETEALGKRPKGKPRKGKLPEKNKIMTKQVTAALSQPLEVWTSAYDHGLSRLKWPHGVTPENTFLWSALMQEQAEVLVRAGLSAKKLASIVAEKAARSKEDRVEQLSAVIGLMDQPLESVAFSWLQTADAFPKSALGIAALAWHLPEHARRPGNEWLTQWVQSVVERIVAYTPDLDESVICHLVLQCELPLLIAVATAGSQRSVLSTASEAMDHLAEYLERCEENPAPWLAHGATYLRAALASVIRCRALANTLGLRKWYPPQQRALSQLLKHAARWARPDGTQLLAAGHNAPRTQALWEALVKQTRNPKALQAAMQYAGLLPAGDVLEQGYSNSKVPKLTHYCADAACVVMQSDWRKKGSRFALDFSDSEICIEALTKKGTPVLAGEWTVQVELEQQAQLQLDEWGEVCWFSDEDVDYLELEAKFGQHARVQRQALFFRQDRMLLLADALLSDSSGQWSLSSRIPLAGDASFEPAQKTTEGVIVTAAGTRCLTLPLHLPEWRRQAPNGSLDVDEETLISHLRGSGERLYTATLISLRGGHAKKPVTWRHLTVGEELRIVGADEALAFRIQIGKKQWVIYRSLARPVRRTALGMHTLSEFLAGRFDADAGDFEPLLVVEANS